MERTLFEMPEREIFRFPGLVERGKPFTTEQREAPLAVAKPRKEKAEKVIKEDAVEIKMKTLNLKKR